MKKVMLMLVAAFALTLSTGCATSNNAQGHAMIGAGVGAVAGALINKKSRGKGAAIGAGVGGILGYIIGNEKDKAEALRQQEEDRLRQQQERLRQEAERRRREEVRTGTVRTTTVTEVLDEYGNVVRTGKTTTTSTTRDSNYVDINDYRKPK